MISNNKEFKILEWDTGYFGFKVASILKIRHSYKSLADILRELKDEKVSLVYWASDSNDPDSQEAAEKCSALAMTFGGGGFLADRKATFGREIGDLKNLNLTGLSEIIEYTSDVPTKELLDLAVLSGEYSRFKVDTRITREKFEGLYKLWIINSVNKKFADCVYVKYYENRAAAMVTLQKKDNVGIIGLIAVDRVLQGKNIGTALVNRALVWSKENGCRTAKVVTQFDNKPACRLYEKCGYSIEKIENFYHFWL